MKLLVQLVLQDDEFDIDDIDDEFGKDVSKLCCHLVSHLIQILTECSLKTLLNINFVRIRINIFITLNVFGWPIS